MVEVLLLLQWSGTCTARAAATDTPSDACTDAGQRLKVIPKGSSERPEARSEDICISRIFLECNSSVQLSGNHQ